MDEIKNATVLLACSQANQLHDLKQYLLCNGMSVYEAGSIAEAETIFQRITPDILLLKSPLNSMAQEIGLANNIRKVDRRFPIIFLADQGSESLAAAALKVGIKDYFTPPFISKEIVVSINRCLNDLRQRARVETHGRAPDISTVENKMVGHSLSLCKVKTLLGKAALMDSNILITGETGTGKELAANYIQQCSSRRNQAFVTINCAALPDHLLESELFGYEKGAFTGADRAYPGKLKIADGGTVFFDEIGDMSACAQAKVLRVIESREVYPLGGKRGYHLNVRIIAATNRDLESLVAQNQFRQDLYYRLNVIRIHLPPLRDRQEDIPHLITHYLEQLGSKCFQRVNGIDEDVLRLLLRYQWPGNIRELKNILEAMFLDPPSEKITLEDLPEFFRRTLSCLEKTTLNERDELLTALHDSNWNKSKAAEMLHWSRMTMYRKMEKYAISPSGFEI